jgi:hypothetical protein
MNSNSNYKRHFEATIFTPFSAIKKVRLADGREQPSFQPFPSNLTPIPTMWPQECPSPDRPRYKAHHKCKQPAAAQPKTSFKAKPMPNFSNPFLPRHFKSNTTSFQEFNLSCNNRHSNKASTNTSRCFTPDSTVGNSFISSYSFGEPKDQKFVFKARPMPDFSKPSFPSVKNRKIEEEKNTDLMDVDLDNNMVIDM